MPFRIVVEAAAVELAVAIGDRPFDDVVEHPVVEASLGGLSFKVGLGREGMTRRRCPVSVHKVSSPGGAFTPGSCAPF